MRPTAWTSARQELRQWLQEKAPSSAELYEAAVYLLYEEEVPGRFRLIAHAVREIGNRLPDTILGEVVGGRLDYSQRLGHIRNKLKEYDLSPEGVNTEVLAESTAHVLIPFELWQLITDLVKDDENVGGANVRKAEALFSVMSRESPGAPMAPVVVQWRNVIAWFQGIVHDSGIPEEAVCGLDEIRNRFELFESTLRALIQEFYSTISELDPILKQANITQRPPNNEYVEHTIALLIRPSHVRYFFDNLENPHWIASLSEKGIFKHPPPPVADSDTDAMMLPIWPATQYLKRMSEAAPEAVFKAIREIPTTDNAVIHRDLLEAAVRLPPLRAAELVGEAKNWARAPYHRLLAIQFGELMAYLARGQQPKAALKLAKTILSVQPLAESSLESTGLPAALYREADLLFEYWDYEYIVEHHVPILVAAVGKDALVLLCALLAAVVRQPAGPHSSQWVTDYSYSWRPAIEEHAQNLGGRLPDLLVEAVRDAARQLVESDTSRTKDIVILLERHRSALFHRIALHVLRQFPDGHMQLIADRLTDRARFGDLDLHHEYSLLAQQCFGQLSSEQQDTILGWIDAGLDIEIVKTQRMARGLPTDEEAIEDDVEGWRLAQLARLGQNLPSLWRHRFDELVKKHGDPEHPTFVTYTSSGSGGPQSPMTADTMRSLPVSQIVAYLKTWRPSDPWEGLSVWHLAQELVKAVTTNPARFVGQAEQFSELDAIYIEALLTGLRQAVQQQTTFDWLPMLRFCRQIVTRDSADSNAETTPFTGVSWTSARQIVAEIIGLGLASRTTAIPFNLQADVWEMLRILSNDADPTPAKEAALLAQRSPRSSGLSIAGTRPSAINSIIQYAFWTQHHQGLEGAGSVDFLETQPALWELLEHHLDPVSDSSLAVRQVYGRRFSDLLYLSERWAEKNVANVFPEDESLQNHWSAAWEAYVIFNRPSVAAYQILEPQYRRAIHKAADNIHTRPQPAAPDERLAVHLLSLYWNGLFPLTQAENPLTEFFRFEDTTLRKYALTEIGRALSHERNRISDEVRQRLVELWSWRKRVVRQNEPGLFSDEIASFGWWFSSGQFEDEWAMAQLKDVLRLGGRVERVGDVLDRLAVIIPDMPLMGLEILHLIISGDQDRLDMSYRSDKIRGVLQVAAQIRELPVRQSVRLLINDLGDRGYLQFRDLLETANL